MEGPTAEEQVNRLVDEYRRRCLWFLREDYYPQSREERLKVLEYIQRHGDSDAFRKAAKVRRWFSPSSNARSADS